MTRRELLAAAAIAGVGALAPRAIAQAAATSGAPAPTSPSLNDARKLAAGKSILLLSGWATHNIGDVGHTPGTLRYLTEHLPDAKFRAPEGGYFMWVELPEGTDVHVLLDKAGEHDVTFVKGTDFLLECGRNTLRLAYSGVTPEQIDEGITRLADAVRSLGVAA